MLRWLPWLGRGCFQTRGEWSAFLGNFGLLWGFRCGLFMCSIELLMQAERVMPNFLMRGIIFIGGIPKFS